MPKLQRGRILIFLENSMTIRLDKWLITPSQDQCNLLALKDFWLNQRKFLRTDESTLIILMLKIGYLPMSILSRSKEWMGAIIDMWVLGLFVVFRKRGDREEDMLSLLLTIFLTVKNDLIMIFTVTERERVILLTLENIKLNKLPFIQIMTEHLSVDSTLLLDFSVRTWVAANMIKKIILWLVLKSIHSC